MMEKQIMELNKRYARKKMLQRFVAPLCVFVMLFTVNSLKMVAQTLSRKPMCGLKEHQHKAKCYDSAGNLICGKVEHQHTDACYQESPTLEIEDDSAIRVNDDLALDALDRAALGTLLERIRLTYPVLLAREPGDSVSEEYLLWQEDLEMLDDFIDELTERLS